VREQCLLCGDEELEEIIDLGSHPFADTFVSEEYEADKVYPLIVDLCMNCGGIQLRTETSTDERYSDTDYSYTSANSKTSRDHWDAYAREITKHLQLQANAKILEIGSNDGYLLRCFKDLGHLPIGVDASVVMCNLANSKLGLFTRHAVFSSSLKFTDQFDLIVANNVFNHSNDPLDFARGVKNLLTPDGTFVFELPYWASGINSLKFDQIYHEHVTYFTVTSAFHLFMKVFLHVNHVELVDYHGGSIRVFVSHKPGESPAVAEFIKKEVHLFDPKFYVTWSMIIRDTRNVFLADLYIRAAAGETFVAVGAAAKGNTFLNYYNLDHSIIDFVTDSSEHKIGKYTPRTRIPIVSDEELVGLGEANVIVLAWNLSDSLKQNLLKLNPNLHFLERP
jgi:SAM-dependent methyltransferase